MIVLSCPPVRAGPCEGALASGVRTAYASRRVGTFEKRSEARAQNTRPLMPLLRHALNRRQRCCSGRVPICGRPRRRVENSIREACIPALASQRRIGRSGVAVPYPLAWDEQRLLFSWLLKRLSEMALFQVNTGSREAEVRALRWEWEQTVSEFGARLRRCTRATRPPVSGAICTLEIGPAAP